MATLLTARTAVKERLDAPTSGGFWPDIELNRWINEGCRDIARATESLRDTATIAVTLPSAYTYDLPANCIRVHNVEWVRTGDTTIYPLLPSRVSNAEAMGWTNQDTSGDPQMYFTWGYAGSASAQLYLWPKPDAAGTITLFYYRLPVEASADGDAIEVPNGWEDLVYDYAEYRARMKDGDEGWRAAREEYQAKLQDHFNVTRDMHDQTNYITRPSQHVWWDFDPRDTW